LQVCRPAVDYIGKVKHYQPIANVPRKKPFPVRLLAIILSVLVVVGGGVAAVIVLPERLKKARDTPDVATTVPNTAKNEDGGQVQIERRGRSIESIYSGNWNEDNILSVETDGWVYTTAFGLVKYNTEGKAISLAYAERNGCINVLDEWVYFVSGGVHKIKTDGTSLTKLNSVDASYVQVVDDWIYYTIYSRNIIKNIHC